MIEGYSVLYVTFNFLKLEREEKNKIPKPFYPGMDVYHPQAAVSPAVVACDELTGGSVCLRVSGALQSEGA